MQLIDNYLPYWPVIAASALFLLLGLWWRLTAARAMELSPKPVSWVKNYRAGGFPFHRVLPRQPKLRWWLVLSALLLAAAFAVGRLVNWSMIYSLAPTFYLRSRYGLGVLILYVLGAAAVYGLLILLFDSRWVAFPGALLFAASAANHHGVVCFLSISLLFLLLWLRAEKPGFPAELLYLASVLSLAPLLALRPALIWLLPCWPLVHWYKLTVQRRSRQLSGGKLLLTLLTALLAWALFLLLAAGMLRFLFYGFRFRILAEGFSVQRLSNTLTLLLRMIRSQLFTRLGLGMTVHLMIDAPLLGFGFWGCCSAWVLAKHRRDARGVFILVVLAALLAAWLLSGSYTLTLALTLSTACVLRDADLGKKRTGTVLLTLAGLCWYIFIQIAAWYVPLTEGLVERLV